MKRIAFIVAGLSVLVGLLVLWNSLDRRPSLTPVAFGKVTPGMSRQDVVSILGPPLGGRMPDPAHGAIVEFDWWGDEAEAKTWLTWGRTNHLEINIGFNENDQAGYASFLGTTGQSENWFTRVWIGFLNWVK